MLRTQATQTSMTTERNHMPHMRWCAHIITQTACGGGAMWRAPNGAPSQRRGSHDQVAVERSVHALPPAVCTPSSVRCGSKPCPWSVERGRRATCAHASRK